MNFTLFTTTNFPEGEATASRIKMISKCLIEAGHNVIIVIFNASNKFYVPGNEKTKGVYDKINYLFLSNKIIRPSGFIGRLLDTLRGILFSPIYLYKKIKNREVDAVIFYDPNLIYCFLCVILCKLKRIPIIVDLVEIQSKCENKQTITQKAVRIGCFLTEVFISRIASSFIVISTKIKEFYFKKGVKEHQTFLLPALVDFDYYQKISSTEISALKNKKYYLYSGSYDEKDGLVYIIKAFSQVLTNSVGAIRMPKHCFAAGQIVNMLILVFRIS